MRRLTLPTICLFLCAATLAAEPPGPLVVDFDPGATFTFGGPVGQRIDANRRDWLIRAPRSNSGLLDMFHLRDRRPAPNVVPWAGEFVGKYLISAIQALRMTDDPELHNTVRAVVGQLIASQAEDGYLGPFPSEQRLLAHWDLWGHYHCMLALMMWHEHTGDPLAGSPLAGNADAILACTKAADLVCKTYLDTDRRVFDAGSHEMNMAIIHALGGLYRRTGAKPYLRMMREIEKDWRRAGDYFRTGLAATEFFRTPKPRWESLHDLQGLVELYRITGDPRYRTAFLNHWQSIRRWDRRNSGAFSSGEQADGNPYGPGAIETCCTIAWMALGVDAIRLSGDPRIADELERSTLNLVMGAQHPSGSWWTYDTPMAGTRAASAHAIVFQARPGTPELNCCSVNGPRGLGMLSEWAIMQSDDGLVLNYFGPMRATSQLADGTTVTVTQQTDYPMRGNVRIQISPQKPAEFPVKIRIPAWSANTKVQVPGSEVAASPGKYLELRQTWRPGDEIALDLDMRLRYEAGDLDRLGRISIYRGPLLLAYDVRHNDFDEHEIPALTPAMLDDARVSFPRPEPNQERIGRFTPWLFVDIPVDGGRALRLCDFGTAGCTGSHYVSWLPAEKIAPPPPVPDAPPDGANVPPGAIVFSWRRPAAAATDRTHTLVIADSPDFRAPALKVADQAGHRLIVPAPRTAGLKPNVDYYWKVIAANSAGQTESVDPPKRFRIDPKLPPLRPEQFSEYDEGPDGVLTAADLHGGPKPTYGTLARASGLQAAAGVDGQPDTAVELDGKTGMITYKIKAFPTHQYSMAVWMSHTHHAGHLGQVFSAWDRGMDDPLRVCIHQGRLFARIEAGHAYSSPGVPVEAGRWYHVAAVKDGSRLTLYLDAKPAASVQVPTDVRSAARDFALGGNPHFAGSSEHLACRLSGLKFYARSLTPEEITKLSMQHRPKRVP